MDTYLQKSEQYLDRLCVEIAERCVGSAGNRAAADFFEQVTSACGWHIRSQEFDAMDWHDGGASLQAGGQSFAVQPSPYSLGCNACAPLLSVESVAALENAALDGKIVLLHGEIAREQIAPKNFVFYNPEEHQHIIALLEKGQPAGIICATGLNSSMAGGVYPFPLIEDGDFDIPSVFMTEEEGLRLLPFSGQVVQLRSDSRRIPGKGRNVLALRGQPGARRVVVTAHIDAKKGTPGAIDNATGVVVLLLLADMLKDYAGSPQIELVAFNGEDYYAVPGQMLYLQSCQDHLDEVLLNINIDGAGYHQGPSAFSYYELPVKQEAHIQAVLRPFSGIVHGEQWVQGDHSIFVQNGRPAVAVSSQWLIEHMENQQVTHTPKDNRHIVDCSKMVEIADALNQVLRNLPF